MSSPIRRRLEDAFVEAITPAMTGVTVLAGGKTEEVVTPYVIVRCKESTETTPNSEAHKFDLRIVMVSDISDSTSNAHDERVEALKSAILSVPKYGRDETHGIQLCGWTLLREESATEDYTYGDVFFIEGGCVAVPEGAGT